MPITGIQQGMPTSLTSASNPGIKRATTCSRWQKEMDQMGNVRLKSPSATLLRVPCERQAAYRGATGKTGTQLAVLESFREQMILPGHTRNARAIGSRKDSSTEIHTDFAAAMKSIDNSLQAGDKLYDSQSASDSEAE
jgi:hypothetical protein